MKKRLACLVLVDIRDGMQRPSIAETAQILRQEGVVCFNQKDAVKLIEGMVNAGHRYRNMEKTVRGGICMALGTGLAESQYDLPRSLLLSATADIL